MINTLKIKHGSCHKLLQNKYYASIDNYYIHIFSNNSAIYNRTRIYPHLFILVTVFGSKVTSITAPPGFGYTLLLVRRNAIILGKTKTVHYFLFPFEFTKMETGFTGNPINKTPRNPIG